LKKENPKKKCKKGAEKKGVESRALGEPKGRDPKRSKKRGNWRDDGTKQF